MDLGAMLAGKRILVTGASSGLGENFAREAARSKAKVVIAARRKARLDALAEELQKLGSPQVTAIEMDVGSEQSIDDAFAEIDASGDILDVVVNNAGVGGDGWALTLPTKDYDNLMAINVRGVWLTSVRAARRWKEAGRGGSIINIASIQGERVMSGITPYSASKAAVVHMTKSSGAGMGALRHPRQRDRAGLHRHRDDRLDVGNGLRQGPDPAHPAAPPRQARGTERPVPALRDGSRLVDDRRLRAGRWRTSLLVAVARPAGGGRRRPPPLRCANGPRPFAAFAGNEGVAANHPGR